MLCRGIFGPHWTVRGGGGGFVWFLALPLIVESFKYQSTPLFVTVRFSLVWHLYRFHSLSIQFDVDPLPKYRFCDGSRFVPPEQDQRRRRLFPEPLNQGESGTVTHAVIEGRTTRMHTRARACACACALEAHRFSRSCVTGPESFVGVVQPLFFGCLRFRRFYFPAGVRVWWGLPEVGLQMVLTRERTHQCTELCKTFAPGLNSRASPHVCNQREGSTCVSSGGGYTLKGYHLDVMIY